jgi:8-amino-3,8-dideoxy-alpha-D-manno-octulosonate transaminase
MNTLLTPQDTAFTLRELPPPRLGMAMLGDDEVELAVAAIRSQRLFRYAYDLPLDQQGPMVSTLEKEVAAASHTRFALGVTSGSAALEVALAALGVGPGDEVIIPAWSWVSCFTSVVRLGALPVMAEIDESLCLATGEITRLKSSRTKAVMVVHYQGVPADMDPLIEEADLAGLPILEDCAEAPGASYRGRPVGSMGKIGILSFQHQKCITSGEGGMVVTSDPLLYERSVRLHDLGFYRGFHTLHTKPQGEAFCGGQYRMNELTGAVALGQYRKVQLLREHCRNLAAPIIEALREFPMCTLRRIPDPTGDFGYETYFFVSSESLRDAFTKQLEELNVACIRMTGTYGQFSRDYCKNAAVYTAAASPFTSFPSWPAPGYRANDFPRTVDLFSRMISIPVGILHSQEDAAYIADAIRHTAIKLGLGRVIDRSTTLSPNALPARS